MIREFFALLAAVIAGMAVATPTAAAAAPVPQTAPYMNLGVAGQTVPSHSGFTSVYFIGDSLTAGIVNIAPAYFPGWKVGINGLGGRPLKDGMGILAATKLPPRTILAMGLFTNDLPTHIAALKSAVKESRRRVGPNGCVIWATVHRPAVGGPSWYGALPGDAAPRSMFPQSASGATYRKANEWLRAEDKRDRNMRLVDWAKSLHDHPLTMEDNDVHPAGADGWQRRAQLYANAARSC